MIRVRHNPAAASTLASNEPQWSSRKSEERGFLLFEDLILDGNVRPIYWFRITPRDTGGVTLLIWWPARQEGEGTPGDCSNPSRVDLYVTHHLPSETRARTIASDFARSERARLVALAIQQIDAQKTLLQGLPA